jgi:DNA replication protein DnaC
MTGIVGKVGSGKTSMLLAILNELQLKKGINTTPDSIAYIA